MGVKTFGIGNKKRDCPIVCVLDEAVRAVIIVLLGNTSWPLAAEDPVTGQFRNDWIRSAGVRVPGVASTDVPSSSAFR